MDSSRLEVPADQLRWRCEPAYFSFQCTDELVPLQEFIGQDRAIKAIDFGLAVDQPGYNIFVTGMTGTGKASVVKAHLETLVRGRVASGQTQQPSDWCYLYNFADADRPRIVGLPPGKGKEFRRSIERLQEQLRSEVPKAYAGDEYEAQRKQIAEESQAGQRQIFQQLETEVHALGFAVQFSPAGVALVPLLDGKPASQEEFARLDQVTRQATEEKRSGLTGRVGEALEAAQELEREAGQRLDELGRQAAEFALAGPFGTRQKAYAEYPELVLFLEGLRDFTVQRIEVFRDTDAGQQQPGNEIQNMARSARERETLLPFSVSLFVDNSAADGPPIIVENNPTFSNLFGRIDRRFVMGGYVTDHTLLKPGSFQMANDGYLVLNMRNLVANPLVWETVKRVIKTKEVRPEDPAEAMGMVVPQSIKPQAMPLNVKVVVTGDTALYDLLSAYDEDFWETFKVKADFDSQIRRTDQHLEAYAAFVCGACTKHGLLHFEPDGVGKVVEYAARLIADQEKLSTRFGLITDLLIEADYWARSGGEELVKAKYVQKALEEKVYRSNLVAERMQELMEEGTLMVDVDGEVVGQVNGLAVFSVGDFSFGKPSRITARTFLGRGGLINIEREAQMSGKTHDKGVLIIGGYLGWKYAQKQPLSVSATIAFEQSYEGVDGDSASSTEVYAILSSLANVPLKQGLAVTGSVNQKGEVQPIGGVNQKIEGFFDLCKAIGLTGQQGVLVPRQNVRNLMLREDLEQAVKEGLFHVYAVGSIDEGIELLTGIPAGEQDGEGKYPEGSLNSLASARLLQFAENLREFGRRNGDGTDGGDKGDA